MLPVGVLDEYIKRCPAAVMGRATVERLFQPERWEEIFERHSASVATCRSEKLAKLIELAERYCVVYQTLKNSPKRASEG